MSHKNNHKTSPLVRFIIAGIIIVIIFIVGIICSSSTQGKNVNNLNQSSTPINATSSTKVDNSAPTVTPVASPTSSTSSDTTSSTGTKQSNNNSASTKDTSSNNKNNATTHNSTNSATNDSSNVSSDNGSNNSNNNTATQNTNENNSTQKQNTTNTSNGAGSSNYNNNYAAKVPKKKVKNPPMHTGNAGVIASLGSYYKVDLHSGPSSHSSKIERLTAGTPITILSTDGSYDYVRLSDGTTGYVYNPYVRE